MSRRKVVPGAALAALLPVLVRLFRRLPPAGRVALVVVAVVAAGAYYFVQSRTAPPVAPDADPTTGLNPDGSGRFLFCFWNVENLFDDRDDDRRAVDETYDGPFATDAALRAEKLDRLCSALLRLNGGKGPDILACAEVESVRAAELLRDALNARLADADLHYRHVSMVNLDGGRHIAPCVVSRLTVVEAATRRHGSQIRVLETRLRVNNHELTVLSSHWTSQLRQRDGTNGEPGRANYVRTLREAYDARLAADPAADVIVCGDFNAKPESEEVRELLSGGRNRLVNLMADKPAARFGTIYYGGEPLVYDHICTSPGLADGLGWACDAASVEVVTAGLTRAGSSRREPWRFGNPGSVPPGGRGYSDHFPVTAALAVAPRAGDLPARAAAP